MTLSPRQIVAYLEFNEKLDRIDRANTLMIAAIGAQGDQQAIEKTLKEFEWPSNSNSKPINRPGSR